MANEIIKHPTNSDEAAKLEKDPDYVTVGIETVNGVKMGLFQKKTIDTPKVETSTKPKSKEK